MRYHDKRSSQKKLTDIFSQVTSRQNFNFLVFLVVAISLPVLLIAIRGRQTINQQAASGTIYPHVQGTQILDGNGNPLYLRGAMIESSLAYINQWKKGIDPLATLNTNTFNAMASWGMDAIRINMSQWIYEYDATTSANPTYLSKLDTAISEANASGLYVILDFHDDCQSGSPHCDGMMHQESLGYWKMLATRYSTNTMIFYDPINEPKYPDWCAWRYGGNPQGRCTTSLTDTTIVGYIDMITAIRSVGGQQIIVLEPGAAGGGKDNVEGGFATIDASTLSSLTDTNLLVSKHDYSLVVSGNPTLWDAQWGPFLNQRPLYFGEWAVLPDANYPSFCKNLTDQNAGPITTAFLSYMDSRHINFTAWAFTPGHMIKDTIQYTPTNFQDGAPWSCQSPSSKLAGMGQTVKDFIASHPTPTFTPTPTPTPSPTPTPTPTPTPSPTPTPTPTPTPLPRLAYDSFARNTTNTWGIATDGQTWNQDALSNKQFSVSHGNGYITNGSDQYNATLGPRIINAVASIQGSTSTFTGSNNLGLSLRWNDNNNLYESILDGKNLFIIRRYQGVRTVLGTTPFNATAGTVYHLKFRVQGSQIQARAWDTNTPEPSTWMVDVTDSALSSGFGGVRTLLHNGTAVISSFEMYGL